MTEHPAISVLLTAKSPFEAEVIAGVLRAAGIPAYVGGQSLQDEFALSQVLANLASVEIQVPSDRLDEAKKAIAEADAAAKLLDRADFDPGPTEPDPDAPDSDAPEPG